MAIFLIITTYLIVGFVVGGFVAHKLNRTSYRPSESKPWDILTGMVCVAVWPLVILLAALVGLGWLLGKVWRI